MTQELLHRQDLASRLPRLLATTNCHLTGEPGAGTTSLLKHGLRAGPHRCVWIDTGRQTTQHRVLKTVYEAVTGDPPPAGIATDEIYGQAKEAVTRPIVVALDHIDVFYSLSPGGLDQLLYRLSEIGGVYTVTCSHWYDFGQLVSQRSASRIDPQNLMVDTLPPEHRKDILEEWRHQYLPHTTVTETALIEASYRTNNLVAAQHWLAAAARYADDVVTVGCLDQTQSMGNRQFHLSRLAPCRQHHELLYEAVDNHRQETPVNAGTVYQWYIDSCNEHGFSPHSYRRISDYLDELAARTVFDLQLTHSSEGTTRKTGLTQPIKRGR